MKRSNTSYSVSILINCGFALLLPSHLFSATVHISTFEITQVAAALIHQEFAQLDPVDDKTKQNSNQDPEKRPLGINPIGIGVPVPNGTGANSLTPGGPSPRRPRRVRGTLEFIPQTGGGSNSPQLQGQGVGTDGKQPIIGRGDRDDDDRPNQSRQGRRGANDDSSGTGPEKFDPDSAEGVLLKFCTAMSEGNLTAASEYISPKAKGLLQKIRDGELDEDRVEEFKEAFHIQGLQQKPSRNATGIGKSIKLGSATGHTLSFVLGKEDDTYVVKEFSPSGPKK